MRSRLRAPLAQRPRAGLLPFVVSVALALGVGGLNVPSARADLGHDPIAAAEAHQERLFETVSPAVVFISSGEVFGSGLLVSASGLVLTNAHVVAGVTRTKVVLADGRSLVGTVIARAPENVDLALVQIPGQGYPSLALTATKSGLRVGAWVASVGHGRGGIWSFNTGMISNIYPAGADRPIFQTQIPLNPGSSGGPVVDRHGRVVGIVTAGMKNSNSINFAIRSEVALRSFPTLAAVSECLVITAPTGVAVFVDGVMAGTGPRIVYPAERKAYEVFAVIAGAMKKRRVTYPRERNVDLK